MKFTILVLFVLFFFEYSRYIQITYMKIIINLNISKKITVMLRLNQKISKFLINFHNIKLFIKQTIFIHII